MSAIENLINNEEFLELLDKEDSALMAEYLNKMRNSDNNFLTSTEYIQINKLFKDLDIFQDIAIYDANPNKKYKYVLSAAFRFVPKGSTIDLSDATVYTWGCAPLEGCNIVVNDKTVLNDSAIKIYADHSNEKFTLTFLGIPQLNFHRGCYINIARGGDVEVLAKKGLKDKVEKLFADERFFASGYITIKEL